MSDTQDLLKAKHNALKEKNGGYMPPPFCFVCEKEMAPRPSFREIIEKKIRVKRIVLTRAGDSAKYPLGLERHSSCKPGTKKWARYQDPSDPKIQQYCRWFSVEAGRQYTDEECEAENKKPKDQAA